MHKMHKYMYKLKNTSSTDPSYQVYLKKYKIYMKGGTYTSSNTSSKTSSKIEFVYCGPKTTREGGDQVYKQDKLDIDFNNLYLGILCSTLSSTGKGRYFIPQLSVNLVDQEKRKKEKQEEMEGLIANYKLFATDTQIGGSVSARINALNALNAAASKQPVTKPAVPASKSVPAPKPVPKPVVSINSESDLQELMSELRSNSWFPKPTGDNMPLRISLISILESIEKLGRQILSTGSNVLNPGGSYAPRAKGFETGVTLGQAELCVTNAIQLWGPNILKENIKFFTNLVVNSIVTIDSFNNMIQRRQAINLYFYKLINGGDTFYYFLSTQGDITLTPESQNGGKLDSHPIVLTLDDVQRLKKLNQNSCPDKNIIYLCKNKNDDNELFSETCGFNRYYYPYKDSRIRKVRESWWIPTREEKIQSKIREFICVPIKSADMINYRKNALQQPHVFLTSDDNTSYIKITEILTGRSIIVSLGINIPNYLRIERNSIEDLRRLVQEKLNENINIFTESNV